MHLNTIISPDATLLMSSYIQNFWSPGHVVRRQPLKTGNLAISNIGKTQDFRLEKLTLILLGRLPWLVRNVRFKKKNASVNIMIIWIAWGGNFGSKICKKNIRCTKIFFSSALGGGAYFCIGSAPVGCINMFFLKLILLTLFAKNWKHGPYASVGWAFSAFLETPTKFVLKSHVWDRLKRKGKLWSRRNQFSWCIGYTEMIHKFMMTTMKLQ